MNSFLKRNRLITKSDFQNLKSGSRFSVSGLVVCYLKPRPPGEIDTRIGIAASKKFGDAHHRNKFKRKIREYFRTSPYKEKGHDILITPNLKMMKSQKISHKDFFQKLDESLSSMFRSNFL